jgi:outer membrane immunogenic protein
MAKLHCGVVALVVGAAGLCGLAAAASADGYVRRGYAPVAACCSWSGMYIGINGGYGFSADDQAVVVTETVQAAPPTISSSGVFGSLDAAGGFGGLQVGYNFQNGGWVFGIEADFQASDISDDAHGFIPNWLPGGLNATVDSSTKVGWFGTLRPRLGLAWDRTLVYATGGFAWGGVKHSLRFVDNFGFTAQDNSSNSQAGYVVGAGVEHMFNCCWSVKFEYQYINLGSEHYSAPLLFTAGGGAPTVFRESTDVDTEFHTLRIGLNWKWDDRRDKPLK